MPAIVSSMREAHHSTADQDADGRAYSPTTFPSPIPILLRYSMAFRIQGKGRMKNERSCRRYRTTADGFVIQGASLARSVDRRSGAGSGDGIHRNRADRYGEV